MISEFISVIVGIVIGQDANIPRVLPILTDLWGNLVEMTRRRTEDGSLMETLIGWFKQD
jgi:hypothetical protein